MNVTLHPRLARFVEEQIQAGRFRTAEDVVNGALARLQTESELSQDDRQALHADIAAGIEEADAGNLEEWDAEEVWAEVERRASADGKASDRTAP